MFALQNSATYKVYPNDPVVVYKNGGFGFNFKNKEAVRNLISNMKEAGEYLGDMESPLDRPKHRK